jgi:excisionase family DNA binding protein
MSTRARRKPYPPPAGAQYLKLAEVAWLLRCSVRTVQRRIEDGELDTIFSGNLLCVPRFSVDAYLERERNARQRGRAA